MESEPAPPTAPGRRPSGSSARRGSASAASRARSGAARVDPARPAAAQEAEAVDEAVETTAEGPGGAAEETAGGTAAATAASAAAVNRTSAAKKPAARKPAARKPTAKKPAAKASTTRKPSRTAATREPPAPADASGIETADEDANETETAVAETSPEPAADTAAVETAEAPEAEPQTSDASGTEVETEVETDGVNVEEAEKLGEEPAEVPSAPAPETPAKKLIRIKRRPVRPTAPASPAAAPAELELALSVEGLTKTFGSATAVDGIDLAVTPGSFFGIVGPNGAGKTTTLSMITGLLRPDGGTVRVFGLDVWANATLAKRQIGVLPDRLRLFDRLTGAEFLYHAGALRGLDRPTITRRSADLAVAFGLEHSLHRLVSDYSAGMTKKIAIAAAMIHAPRLLVLDEPFESVDPVSTALVIGVLQRFTAAGGTIVLSSHSMELTERVCDAIAVIVDGRVLAEGPIAEVLQGRSLEERFVELAGGESAVEGMEWLQNFSD